MKSEFQKYEWFRLRKTMAMGAAVGCLLLAGCVSGGGGDVATSGDPEADQRAEQRMGGDTKDGKKQVERTLFERLGGEAGIATIVDEMTERVIADPRVNFERRNIRSGLMGKYDAWNPSPENVQQFARHMVEFISLAAGGPAQYTGRDLRVVHQGMKITNAEFDALVGDLKVSMDRLNVGTREQRDLLAIIETTRKQVVEER